MSSLNVFQTRVATLIGIIGAAYSTAAALRVHHRPSADDLHRLGIRDEDFTVRL